MFCSVKIRENKNGRVYRFYLSDRYRDKTTSKVKSSDTFIISLHENDVRRSNDEEMLTQIASSCSDKNIKNEDTTLIINKFNDIKSKIGHEYSPKVENIKLGCPEIIQTEIVEDFDTTSNTTISIDVIREFNDKVKSEAKMQGLFNAFGGPTKTIDEIVKEHLEEIKEDIEHIQKRIDEIKDERIKINELNEGFNALGSNLKLVQDIHIGCYKKVPSSNVYLIGGGYFIKIYGLDEDTALVIPDKLDGSYSKRYKKQMLKKYDIENSKDNIGYIVNLVDELRVKGIFLDREDTLHVDENDIEGSKIRIMLLGNYKIDQSSTDYIDLMAGDIDISINISMMVDRLNKGNGFEEAEDWHIDYDNLLAYEQQIYKFNNVM